VNSYGNKKLYYYITSDWEDIELLVESLNNAPAVYDELIHYYYEYKSIDLESTGRIIG
jgi:hypothetical protein